MRLRSSAANLSLDDPRVAQIEPIAGVEILTVVDQDPELFDAIHVHFEGQRRVFAGNRRFGQKFVVAEDRKYNIAVGPRCRLDASDREEAAVTAGQVIRDLAAATESQAFGKRLDCGARAG